MNQVSLKSRLFRNLGANAYGQIITIGVQLLSVPVFLHYWGIDLYGEWLLLSAIPTYLSLSEMGFATVAANSMTMCIAQDDRKGALEIYQSTWLLICSVSFVVAVLFGMIAIYAPVADLFSITQISSEVVIETLLVLIIYALVGLQFGVFIASYRTVGRYALVTVLVHSIRLIEWIAAVVVLVFEGGVLNVALAIAVVRVVGVVVLWFVLYTRYSWIKLGVSNASFRVIRRLFRPATAFMAFPVGLAFSMQGVVIVLGITLGGAAVAIFSTYRTLSRILVQLVNMLSQSVWPELTTAYGQKNMSLVKTLFFKGSSLSFWASIICFIMLALSGEWIVDLWTHGAIGGHQNLFLLLLGSALLNALWMPSWTLLMATSQHQSVAGYYIIYSTLMVITVAILTHSGDINGAGITLLVFEVPMLYFVVRKGLNLITETWASYAVSFLRFPWK